MTNINTNISAAGIQNTQSFDPHFGLNLFNTQAGIDQVEPAPFASPIQTPTAPLPIKRGVQSEKEEVRSGSRINESLANIRSLSAAIPDPGSKPQFGQIIGGVGGTIVGGPTGGAVGQAIGSIVDYGLNKSENDKIKRADLISRRKQINREKRLANTQVAINQKLKVQGISNVREQEQLSEEALLEAQRDGLLSNLTNDINKKAQFNDFLKSKYLQSRSVV